MLALSTDSKHIAYLIAQIEQFIESIFPSQKPGQAAAPMPAGLTAAEAEKREAEEKEAKWDMIYLTMAVMGFLTFLTLLMVISRSSNPFEPLLTYHRSELHISRVRGGHHSSTLPRITLASRLQRPFPALFLLAVMASSSQCPWLLLMSIHYVSTGEIRLSRVVLASYI